MRVIASRSAGGLTWFSLRIAAGPRGTYLYLSLSIYIYIYIYVYRDRYMYNQLNIYIHIHNILQYNIT